MTYQGDEVSTVRWTGEGGRGVELRPIAGGVVAGLGAFFLVRHLLVRGGDSLHASASAAPFLLLSLTLVYAGVWLLRCDVGDRRVCRVAAYALAGCLSLAAVGVWLVGGQGLPVRRFLLLTLDVGTVGASAGLLAGLVDVRRGGPGGPGDGEAALAAERAEERFAFLNRLLRHHLLNGVAVVRGHAEVLSDRFEEPPEEVRVIRRRSDELAGLIKNVETLARAVAGDLGTRRIDPSDPLRDAIEAVRRERPDVEIHTDVREVAPVAANRRLDLAFEALLRFAVEAGGGGRLAVSTAATRERVVVRISTGGHGELGADLLAGRPEADDPDLGLYLAETLVEYFGGSVDRPADGEAGIAVRLPATPR